MNTKIVKWLMMVVFSILALTGCFVHHDRDDYYRDRDGRYYRDQGDWTVMSEETGTIGTTVTGIKTEALLLIININSGDTIFNYTWSAE